MYRGRLGGGMGLGMVPRRGRVAGGPAVPAPLVLDGLRWGVDPTGLSWPATGWPDTSIPYTELGVTIVITSQVATAVGAPN